MRVLSFRFVRPFMLIMSFWIDDELEKLSRYTKNNHRIRSLILQRTVMKDAPLRGRWVRFLQWRYGFRGECMFVLLQGTIECSLTEQKSYFITRESLSLSISFLDVKASMTLINFRSRRWRRRWLLRCWVKSPSVCDNEKPIKRVIEWPLKASPYMSLSWKNFNDGGKREVLHRAPACCVSSFPDRICMFSTTATSSLLGSKWCSARTKTLLIPFLYLRFDYKHRPLVLPSVHSTAVFFFFSSLISMQKQVLPPYTLTHSLGYLNIN